MDITWEWTYCGNEKLGVTFFLFDPCVASFWLVALCTLFQRSLPVRVEVRACFAPPACRFEICLAGCGFGAGVSDVVVIVGQGAEEVKADLANVPNVHYALQHSQLGTGDAVKSARTVLEGYQGPVMVLV